MYLEMIFGKNKEQTTRQLQFKFDPLPAESAEICLFRQGWVETFDTQVFGQLCITYVLIYYKIDLIQFCNKYMVDPLQKNSFWAFKKSLKTARKIQYACKFVIIHKMWSNLSDKSS